MSVSWTDRETDYPAACESSRWEEEFREGRPVWLWILLILAVSVKDRLCDRWYDLLDGRAM